MSNILLLEDDLSLINGLSFALKKQGFELAVARTLKEADSLWIDGKYDLLILDVSQRQMKKWTLSWDWTLVVMTISQSRSS